METLHTILVPTDFSKYSEHAMLYASSLGERFGATLHLLHVVSLRGYEGGGSTDDFPDITPLLMQADEAARKRLDAGAAHGGEAKVEVIKALTRSFNAHEAIADYAKRKAADLIVIATRGNTGLVHVLMGSVTERVVRYSPCPVLVVEEGDRDFVDAETGRVSIKRVVIADDLSDNADVALQRAVGFLTPYQPEIHVVHAVNTDVPPAYAMAGVESVFQMWPDLRGKLSALIDGRTADIVPETWKVHGEVREGKPHKTVTDYAAEVEADLLVVASETRIDLSERFVGGTTERIVRHSPCPTLII